MRELKLLLVEDSEEDAVLLLHELKHAGYELVVRRVDSAESMQEALEASNWDLVISDYVLPCFSGPRALSTLQASGRDLPFIAVSGVIGEEAAVSMMKAGAQDYLTKHNLTRLAPAVERGLREAEVRRRRREAEEELRVKTEELKAMSAQLWQAAKLSTLGELAASIAHELNNPLAIVSLRVDSLLTDLSPDDGKRRAVEVIEREVDRMRDLVANLLNFSRRRHPQISSVDVAREIDNTLDLIQYHLRNRRIQVVREFASHLKLIHADRQQLRQLILNLLSNAADAMEEGGTLTIGVAPATLGDGRSAVRIELTDTGAGIPQESLSAVMEPFFTTKPEGKGTGLGLPICRRVVQEHNGLFEIESEVGRGTTVRVVLPVANGTNSSELLSDA